MNAPNCRRSQLRSSVPSRRTRPAVGGRQPTSSLASVDLPEPDGPTTASDCSGLELERHAVEHGLLDARRDEQKPVRRQLPCGTRQLHARRLAREGFDCGDDPPVGRLRLHDAAPAFDHAFERLQGAAGDDRGGDHHAAGDLPFQREVCAPAEHQDLRHEAEELRRAADPEIAVEGAALHGQRARVLVAPMGDALVQHAHGVDHLRVAAKQLGALVGARGMHACLSQRHRRRALVEHGDAAKKCAGDQRDDAELRVDEKYCGEVERRQRRVEQQQHDGAGEEIAHVVQAAHRFRRAASVACGVEMTLASSVPPSMVSSRLASAPSTCRRQMSSSDSTARKLTASIDSMSSVSMLRLVSTRSESWNR